MAEQEERKEEQVPGQLVKITGVREKERVIDIADREGFGRAVRLPIGQHQEILRLLNQTPDRKWVLLYQWRKRGELGSWEGVILAGPFEEAMEKTTDLVGDEQLRRWFNQFLEPTTAVSWVDKVQKDPIYGLRFWGSGEVGKDWFTLDKVLLSMAKSELRTAR